MQVNAYHIYQWEDDINASVNRATQHLCPYLLHTHALGVLNSLLQATQYKSLLLSSSDPSVHKHSKYIKALKNEHSLAH